jgi:hypothetical protein
VTAGRIGSQPPRNFSSNLVVVHLVDLVDLSRLFLCICQYFGSAVVRTAQAPKI